MQVRFHSPGIDRSLECRGAFGPFLSRLASAHSSYRNMGSTFGARRDKGLEAPPLLSKSSGYSMAERTSSIRRSMQWWGLLSHTCFKIHQWELGAFGRSARSSTLRRRSAVTISRQTWKTGPPESRQALPSATRGRLLMPELVWCFRGAALLAEMLRGMEALPIHLASRKWCVAKRWKREAPSRGRAPTSPGRSHAVGLRGGPPARGRRPVLSVPDDGRLDRCRMRHGAPAAAGGPTCDAPPCLSLA